MSKKVKRLFENFQPQHYKLELHPERDHMTISGTVTIEGKKTGRPSQRLTFHQKGLTIDEATITKKDKKGEQSLTVTRINHQRTFDEVRLHTEELLYGGQYRVTLRFSGKISDGMHGIYPCYYELDGKRRSLIATQFESHHAREAFPCIDEPEAKATFDLTLLSPIGEAVVGNMPITSQLEKNGLLVTNFETTPKMSTYLLAFVYGDMHCKETATKDGVRVRVWGTAAQPAESFDFALEISKRTIEFYNDYFDTPYPLAKCDHVALPDFSSAAMENWGLITYREPYLLVNPHTTGQSMREVVSLVIAHETSHQWFGNLVTMKWWDELWLNESFANVMEYVAVNALFPEWEIWNTFVTQEGLSSQRRDCIAGVQSVRSEVRHPDEIGTLFDPSIVYAKGGRLLNMLMKYLGETDFRKGLKIYFTKHAYGNTAGADLWQALSEASGKDVAAFMDPWLTRSGFPAVTVEQSATELKLSQSHFLLDPAKADSSRYWPVPLLSDAAGVPDLLEGPDLTCTLPTSDFVLINKGAVGHYIVRYAKPEHAAYVASLVDAERVGVAERLMLLSDSSMLARAGFQSFAQTLELLEHYVKEDSEPVWDIILLITADCRRFIDIDEELEAPLKALIRQLIQPQYDRLGWEEKPNEPSHDVKLRATIIALGIYAEHPDIVAEALRRFKAYKTNDTAIPSELRSIVFGAAIRQGASGAFTYLLELEEKTSNVDLKQDLISALPLTRVTKEIEQLLERIKNSTKVRAHDVDHWLVNLLRNRYSRPQAWDWLRAHWSWVEETFDGDKSYDYFPRYAASAFNTRDLLEEYKAFFEPKQEQAALARNIAMGIEELTTRVIWLERDVDSVKAYLQKFAN